MVVSLPTQTKRLFNTTVKLSFDPPAITDCPLETQCQMHRTLADTQFCWWPHSVFTVLNLQEWSQTTTHTHTHRYIYIHTHIHLHPCIRAFFKGKWKRKVQCNVKSSTAVRSETYSSSLVAGTFQMCCTATVDIVVIIHWQFLYNMLLQQQFWNLFV
jgi:hypothetical protein